VNGDGGAVYIVEQLAGRGRDDIDAHSRARVDREVGFIGSDRDVFVKRKTEIQPLYRDAVELLGKDLGSIDLIEMKVGEILKVFHEAGVLAQCSINVEPELICELYRRHFFSSRVYLHCWADRGCKATNQEIPFRSRQLCLRMQRYEEPGWHFTFTN